MAMKKAEGYANKLIVVDGVYSMDGDIAPLPDILAIARNNDAWLMLDESHALGVVGENGWGTHSHFSLETRCDFITCSMGKALGGVGGFVAGSSQLIRFLEITCRPFVYSTSLPQNVAVQLQEALHIMKTEPSIHRRLMENAAFFKTGLETLGFETTGSESAIIPIIIRDETKLLRFCQYLHDRGVFVNPVFYPVVPKKKSRIRASVTAQLTSEALSYSLDVMASAASSLGIIH
jgi:glycine C-acetyltransferase